MTAPISEQTVALEVGVVVMPINDWPSTLRRAQELEAMGFDHYWLYDHHSWRHYRDQAWHSTIPWLAGVAAGTNTIGLGTMVSSPNLRHPATMAKDAMSLDHISNGRMILGLGAGTTGFDATLFGDSPLTPRQRVDRLVEYVDVVDRVLTGEHNHSGKWYTVDEGRVIPGCVRQPRVPLAVAAGGARTLRLAAERADTWITLGKPSEPAEDLDQLVAQMADQTAAINEHCHQIGRAANTLNRLAFVSSARREPTVSLAAFVDFAGRVQELGFNSVVLHDRVAGDDALNFEPGLIDQIAAWKRAR